MLTRLPYDHEVESGELSRIEKAELFLARLGYRAARVRSHGGIARIELERDRISQFIVDRVAEKVVPYFKSIGYVYVTLDLEGYRTGSFNETIKPEKNES